jgi:hypothetical protein
LGQLIAFLLTSGFFSRLDGGGGGGGDGGGSGDVGGGNMYTNLIYLTVGPPNNTLLIGYVLTPYFLTFCLYLKADIMVKLQTIIINCFATR